MRRYADGRVPIEPIAKIARRHANLILRIDEDVPNLIGGEIHARDLATVAAGVEDVRIVRDGGIRILATAHVTPCIGGAEPAGDQARNGDRRIVLLPAEDAI